MLIALSSKPPQVLVDPTGHSACAPDCKVLLRLVEDPGGHDITLRAMKNYATLEIKTFHLSESVTSDPEYHGHVVRDDKKKVCNLIRSFHTKF